jgi:hypothetical protein
MQDRDTNALCEPPLSCSSPRVSAGTVGRTLVRPYTCRRATKNRTLERFAQCPDSAFAPDSTAAPPCVACGEAEERAGRVESWLRRGLIAALILLGLVPVGFMLPSPLSASHGTGSRILTSTSAVRRAERPVLAFYYTWYHRDTWCRCTMSDVPTKRYDSSDVGTIDRQIAEAARSGITGFIASWPGPGNTQDFNLGQLLRRSAVYQRKAGTHFVSAIYFESDAVAIRHNLAGAMRYAVGHYTSDPHFFRWQGKPVIFIWDPLGNGRTLETWASVRRRIDPHHRLIWSAEGTDTRLLKVFDGLHLYSAAYWGLLDGAIGGVDQSFRSRVDAYSAVTGTHKIWAAGVEPGYDDTRIPGRAGTYRVPRTNGATYRASWLGAMSSAPDWITITSFNEWFEGAMIEPSKRYGALYLTLTKQFAQLWRHLP